MKELNKEINEGLNGALLVINTYSQGNEELNKHIDIICKQRLKEQTSWLKKLRSISR